MHAVVVRRRELLPGRDTARYAWLLLALGLVFVLPPVLETARLGLVGLRVALAAVLIAALVVVGRRRPVMWLGLALALPAVCLDWAALLLHAKAPAMVGSAFAIGFYLLFIAAALDAMIRADRVTTDVVLGGICIYLILALLFVSAFTLLENLAPGSLLRGGEPLALAPTAQPESFRFSELLYFSCVTLTTLGYGDITPAQPYAFTLASVEAIAGQLYLAIFIARLVGLHMAHAHEPR